MAEDTVQYLHGQVLVLDAVKKPDTLHVVEKFPDPVFFAEIREAGLTEMPVRDVTDIMPERDCLDEILVEAQASAYRTGNLRDELDMDNPVGDVIVLDQVKDLCFVDIP
jgi:hypothetical protein